MEQREIIKMYNFPDIALVDHAVSRANLTAAERQVIELRERQSMTVEGAAEYLSLSEITVKKRYRSGMSKLNTCWSGLSWIESIIKQ